MNPGTIDIGVAKTLHAEKEAAEQAAARAHVDQVREQIPLDMEKATRLAKDSKAVGFVTLIVMGNGEVTMFQNTAITNVYHMVGALEVAKARLLK